MRLRKSEARIIIYLDVADKRHKNTTQISRKLNMDYGFTLRTLHAMKARLWVKSIRNGQKVFYELTSKTPMKSAISTMERYTK